MPKVHGHERGRRLGGDTCGDGSQKGRSPGMVDAECGVQDAGRARIVVCGWINHMEYAPSLVSSEQSIDGHKRARRLGGDTFGDGSRNDRSPRAGRPRGWINHME